MLNLPNWQLVEIDLDKREIQTQDLLELVFF